MKFFHKPNQFFLLATKIFFLVHIFSCFIPNNAVGQSDTEFWFVAPEATLSHQYPGGVAAYLKFSTGLLPARVTISMPGNTYHPTLNPTGFHDIVRNIPAHSFWAENMSQWIVTPYPYSGILFEYDPAISTFTKKHDFDNVPTGAEPYGSVIEYNGKLYGMTHSGGNSEKGTIFEYDPVTSTYTRKFDFIGSNGQNPYGSLLEYNGKLYGMTSLGGNSSRGVIFEFDPVTFTINVLYHFNANGRNPYGSLIRANNGLFYGLTSSGGLNNRGVIFEYNLATLTYNMIFEFNLAANGQLPYGSLVQAANGRLYGMTYRGGANDRGVIFECTTAGAYNVRYSFADGANGRYPYGSLVEATPGGLLYGMTNNGGANNLGVLFSFNPNNPWTYTKRVDFSGANNGSNPYGTLMVATGGQLWGMTHKGGVNDRGTLFEYTPGAAAVTKRYDFTGNNNGNYPYLGALTQAGNGKLYGLTIGINSFPAGNPSFPDVVDINKLENKPLTADGINNFGIKITSDNTITAYYEISRQNNKEIWALKGKNALGTEFFTPFQTHGANQTLGYGGTHPANPFPVTQPYSAIDVVATEDLTTVTFTPLVDASYGALPYNQVAAGTDCVVNLKIGETFSLFPKDQSRATADRLAGTKIVSNKKIAVTLKDDSFFHSAGTCYDIAGDQLVPTSIIGKEYAVIRSELNNNDHIYILGTQAATQVRIYNTIGTEIASSPFTIGIGQQEYIPLPNTEQYYRIVADKPVYVWHVGGFGCEQGGAVLPPIDICTGTTQVAFSRTSDETFFILLMVRKGAEDGFLFDGVKEDVLFPPGNFIPIPNSNWSVFRFGGVNGFSTSEIGVGSHFMENTKDIFHLGIVNGGGSSGCYYGYFSDYNPLNINAVVAGTGSQYLQTCYGIPVQLYASGGTKYKWYQNEFDPAVTLNNDAIQLPMANATTNTHYKVVVSGACQMKDSAYIDVQVSTPISASFTTDIVSGCAPLTVNFQDFSTGTTLWQYIMGDGTEYWWDTNSTTPEIDPPSPFTFSHEFHNDTSLPIEFTITLLAKNGDGCSDQQFKRIVVYPSIGASFTPNIPIDGGCANPFDVTFTNTSVSSTIDRYIWDFGDGFGVTHDPLFVPYLPFDSFTHTYTNDQPTAQNYNVELTAISPFGCQATATNTVDVTSFFKPEFTLNKANGCAKPNILGVDGLTVNVANISQGDIDSHSWTVITNPPIAFSTAGFPAAGANADIFLPNSTNTPITYTISLTVTNSKPCTKTTATQVVTVYPPVNPAFTMLAEVCNNTSVQFNGPPQTAPLSTYSWTFGDGAGGSSLVSPSYTYNNVYTSPAGNYIGHTYDVKLVVRSPWGCKDSITHPINVAPYVNADFNIFPGDICSGEQLFFNNNSSGNDEDTHLWDFGDATGYNDANPLPKGYTNTTAAPITRTITYTRTTRVNALLCPSIKTHDVIVYPAVNISNITPSITTICDSVVVAFTSTLTPSLLNMTYTWSFGDGYPGGGASTSHRYRNLTNAQVAYPVLLEARSEYGCWNTRPATVNVEPYIKAQASANKVEICSGEAIDFSYLRMPSIQNYSFAFIGYPDGSWPTDAVALGSFTKTFTNQTGVPMLVTVRLTVNNGNFACNKTFEIPITVNPEVTAGFTQDIGTNAFHCNPLSVNFPNTTEFTGGAVFNGTYLWEFSDGASSEEIAPTHEFINSDANGDTEFNIKLTATSVHGCTDTISQKVLVQSRLEAFFSFSQSSQCTPVIINFNPSSSVGATQYDWNYSGIIPIETLPNGNAFDRAISATDPNLTISYPVTLTVHNAAGCAETYTTPITIHPLVVAAFTPDINEGCADFDVVFTNTSTGGSLQFDWDFGNNQGYSTPSNIPFTHTFTNRGSVDSIYTVSLVTTNISTGCDAILTSTIRVHPKVEANYTLRVIDLCEPMKVELTNSSLNGSNFSWTFTPENTSGFEETATTDDPTLKPEVSLRNNAINDNLTYTITFNAQTVWNTGLPNFTCPSSAPVQTISVAPKLTLGYDVAPPAICSDEEMTFTPSPGNTGGVANLTWTFGEGNTALSQLHDNVSHTFINLTSTPFNASTEVFATQTATGCTASATIPVTVYPRVTASQSFLIGDVCNGVTVNLSNSSSNVLIANSSFEWLFTTSDIGGTTQSVTSAVNPVVLTNTHKTLPVTYNLTFNASTLWGFGTAYERTCSSTVTGEDVTVYPLLEPVYTSPGPACSGLTGVELTFLKEASSSGGLEDDVTLEWNFGDGNTKPSNYTNESNLFINLGPNDFITPTVVKATQIATGCTEEIFIPVLVHPKVQSIFSFSVPDQCAYPLVVDFENSSIVGTPTSTNTTLFNWSYTWSGNTQTEVLTDIDPHDHEFYNSEPNDTSIYTIKLIPLQSHNSGAVCKDSTTKTITVYPRLIADFSLLPSRGCNPLTVTFNNDNSDGVMASQGGRFEWTLSENSFSALQTPDPKIYSHFNKTASEVYNVSLKVVNPIGCEKDDSHDVTVYPLVEARFIAENPEGCSPLDVTFQNLSTSSAYQYNWDFVYNGQTLGIVQPFGAIRFENIPANPNTDDLQDEVYEVSLITGLEITSDILESCADTVKALITVHPRVYPQFTFKPGSSFEGCHPLNVLFDNKTNASGGPGPNNATYLWNFGNTVTSTLLDPTQAFLNTSFTQNKPFNVSLKAVSEHGCDSTINQTVTVYPKPKAVMELVSPYQFCPDTITEIRNISQGIALSYTYEPLPVSTNANTATFNFDNLGSDIEPYTITLTASTTTTDSTCVDVTSQTVYVYPRVKAEFNFNPGSAACNPFTVTMENSSSNANYYTWDFDYNELGSGLVAPTHRFVNDLNVDKEFDVNLYAESEYLCNHDTTMLLTVYASPVVEFAIDTALRIYPNAQFFFTNETSPSHPNWTYTWNFGDLSPDNPNMNPGSYTYTTWGPRDNNFIYNVSLSVVNNEHVQCKDSILHWLVLRPAEPVASFTSNIYEDCSPLDVNFYNYSEYGYSYLWDFGDGSPQSTEREPEHRFTDPGYYNVKLVVEGDGGVRHFYQVYQVFENPIADYEIAPDTVLLPNATVHFFSKSKLANRYEWNFGDNSFLNSEQNPIHTYDQIGKYDVRLTVWSENECPDTKIESPAIWVIGYGDLRFPNAFIPSKLGPSENGEYDAVDFSNQIFHPVHHGVEEYSLTVFNRWGQQVFESKDVLVGWDGYYNGKPLPQDVYVWRAIGKYVNGEQFDMRGNVTLLR